MYFAKARFQEKMQTVWLGFKAWFFFAQSPHYSNPGVAGDAPP